MSFVFVFYFSAKNPGKKFDNMIERCKMVVCKKNSSQKLEEVRQFARRMQDGRLQRFFPAKKPLEKSSTICWKDARWSEDLLFIRMALCTGKLQMKQSY